MARLALALRPPRAETPQYPPPIRPGRELIGAAGAPRGLLRDAAVPLRACAQAPRGPPREACETTLGRAPPLPRARHSPSRNGATAPCRREDLHAGSGERETSRDGEDERRDRPAGWNPRPPRRLAPPRAAVSRLDL